MQVAQHIPRSHPHDPYPMLLQPLIPRPIASDIAAHLMGTSIHFDPEPSDRAIKIEHVRTERMLAAKLESGGSGAKDLP
jgi:hypothetical protein